MSTFETQKTLIAAAVAGGVLTGSALAVSAAEEVNVYSYRQPFLVEPLFKGFTDRTDILHIRGGCDARAGPAWRDAVFRARAPVLRTGTPVSVPAQLPPPQP